MRPRAFASSRAARGKRARVRPVPYMLRVRVVRPNIWVRGGMNSTLVMRVREVRAARFRFLLVKTPVFRRERADRML